MNLIEELNKLCAYWMERILEDPSPEATQLASRLLAAWKSFYGVE